MCTDEKKAMSNSRPMKRDRNSIPAVGSRGRGPGLLASTALTLPALSYAQSAQPSVQSTLKTAGPMVSPSALPHDYTPWGMFLSADIVVKAVMIGLALASLLTWTIWLAKHLELSRKGRRLAAANASLSSAKGLADAQGGGGARCRYAAGGCAYGTTRVSGSDRGRQGAGGRAARAGRGRSQRTDETGVRECSRRSARPPHSWGCSARSGAS